MANDIVFKQDGNLFDDVSEIVESAQKFAYQSVDRILVLRNWLLGKRIATENMFGTREDRYGAKIIDELAKQLTKRYGKGFDKRNLYRCVKFYQMYPKIVATLSPQSFKKTKRR